MAPTPSQSPLPIPSQSPEPIPADRSLAPRPPFFASPLVNLILRVFTFLFILASMIFITTNTLTVIGRYYYISDRYYYTFMTLHSLDMNAYRYMLFTLVVGLVYMLLQIGLNLHHVMTGKLVNPVLGTFDFYGDKVISYILATGAAAAFGITVDSNEGSSLYVQLFWNKANVAASLLLIAFVFSAVSSVFSSLALRKQY